MVFTAPLEGCIIALKNDVKGALAMAHVMKFTKASCGHMFAHFDRKAEHISNENLDRKDTPQLQSRHPSDDGSGRVCTQRCAEVHCQNRKDVNVMATWVVTVPRICPNRNIRLSSRQAMIFCNNAMGVKMWCRLMSIWTK